MSNLADLESLTVAQITKALAEAGVPLPSSRILKIDLITLAKNNAKSPWCQSGKPARKSLGKEAAAAPAAPKARSKTPAKTATLEPPAPLSPHKAAVVAEAVTAATPGEKKSSKKSTPAKEAAAAAAAAAVSPAKASPSNIIKKAAATPRGDVSGRSEAKAPAAASTAVNSAAAKSWSMLIFWALLFASIVVFVGVNRFTPCMKHSSHSNGACTPIASFLPVNVLSCNAGYFLLNGGCVKCPPDATCNDIFTPVKCSSTAFYVAESSSCVPLADKACVASARAVVSFLRRQLGRYEELDMNNVTVNGTAVKTQVSFTASAALAAAAADSSQTSCVEKQLALFKSEVKQIGGGNWQAVEPLYDVIGYAKKHYVITGSLLFAALLSSN